VNPLNPRLSETFVTSVSFNDARTRVIPNGAVVTTIVAAIVTSSLAAQQAYEPPPKFTATTMLGQAVVKGPHYQVAEGVRTDEYFHEFIISSTYGSFRAVGRTQLAVRIQEIGALAALDDVSKTEVFLAAAGQSVVKIGKGAAAVVTNPGETAKGLGAGIKRFGVNLGRRTERAAASTNDDKSADAGNAAGNAASSLLGVNAATRRWAQKVGVDPYTTNVVLQKALEDIAKVDAAGAIATKVVVPIPGVVGLTSTVGGIVWGKDPEEVRKLNEQSLRKLAVPEAVAKTLFGNRWFTLTYQTRLIAALGAVNVGGVADYVQSAAGATSEREALFFVESAEMLQRWHAREPVSRVLTDSRAMVAAVAGGRARALLPLDWIRWTAETQKALTQIAARARQELKATRLEIELTGRASERTVRELPGLGWTVVPAEVKR
jgi:hypothetical protein